MPWLKSILLLLISSAPIFIQAQKTDQVYTTDSLFQQYKIEKNYTAALQLIEANLKQILKTKGKNN